jgi:DNA polymerase/3'-5' exonuclease PolX
MSTATRVPLAQAEDLAHALADLLRASCARIEIAGSIRRRKPDVGDLELVAIAHHERVLDMFGTPTGQTVNLLEERVSVLFASGEVAPRLDKNGQARLGAKYKALWYRGMAVDLFVTSPECWGVIFTIRTGPADFSHRLVTPCSQRLPDGRPGLLPDYLRVREGRLVGSGGRPLDTPEEESVFSAIGLAWLAPEARR